MNDGASNRLYLEFGKLVRLHRNRIDGMTQEKLGRIVGLSRTSITNIEKEHAGEEEPVLPRMLLVLDLWVMPA